MKVEAETLREEQQCEKLKLDFTISKLEGK
jgi:hypothetical protein